MLNRSPLQSRSNSDIQKMQRLRRWIVRITLVPILLFLLLALAVAYRIHAGNRAVDQNTLPPVQSPSQQSSILIFSPHPDDETLGTGGLIQRTLTNGGKVHVVFMTNGDAFRVGVSSYYKILSVAPADYIKYGEMRQKEALASLSTLGLPASDVIFLGYPDRGLMGMWETNWTGDIPYESGYSKQSINPYPNAPSYGTPYCGKNVLQDVEQQLIADQPTDVYVTHPTDDHPDHSAASSFIFIALQQLKANGYLWAQHVRLHYFLIHRGDWPVPQGNNPDQSLAPPAAFVGLDTKWLTLALSHSEVETKASALNHYISQEEMMDRFLVSFIRKNEIYGDLPDSSEIASDFSGVASRTAADDSVWSQSTPIAEDPVGDTDLRVFQPAGDISAVYAGYDERNLYVRFTVNAKLSKTVWYKLSLRAFDGKMNTPAEVLIMTFSPRNVDAGATWKFPTGQTANWSGSSCEYVIPLATLGIAHPTLILAQASTSFSHVVVDHTGYRPIFLQSARPSPAVS